MKKRFFWALFSFILLISIVFSIQLLSSAEVTSGKCGDNLYWEFDESTGLLSITGYGAMYDYEYYKTPWISIDGYLNSTGKVKKISLPDGLTKIGKNAFRDFPILSGELKIPDSVIIIGDFAFCDCTQLTGTLNLPSKLKTIGEMSFQLCKGFTGELVIPSSVTYIGKAAFSFCSGLSGELFLPDTIGFIGECAFGCCSGFSGDLNIPKSISSIEYGVFLGCSGFSGNLIIPERVTSIGEAAFLDCGFSNYLFQSDAPYIAPSNSEFPAFSEDATLYYIEGKAGWTKSSYSGYKTANWDGKSTDGIEIKKVSSSTSPSDQNANIEIPEEKDTDISTDEKTNNSSIGSSFFKFFIICIIIGIGITIAIKKANK